MSMYVSTGCVFQSLLSCLFSRVAHSRVAPSRLSSALSRLNRVKLRYARKREQPLAHGKQIQAGIVPGCADFKKPALLLCHQFLCPSVMFAGFGARENVSRPEATGTLGIERITVPIYLL